MILEDLGLKNEKNWKSICYLLDMNYPKKLNYLPKIIYFDPVQGKKPLLIIIKLTPWLLI